MIKLINKENPFVTVLSMLSDINPLRLEIIFERHFYVKKLNIVFDLDSTLCSSEGFIK